MWPVGNILLSAAILRLGLCWITDWWHTSLCWYTM